MTDKKLVEQLKRDLKSSEKIAKNYQAFHSVRNGAQMEVERLKQRLDDVNVKDSVKTREINLLVDEDHKLRTLLRELAEALKDIRSDPHGCVFCDSGKLRNPQKQHQPRCGFAKIDAALARAEEVLK